MIDTELKQVPYISLFRFIKPNSERFKLLSRSPQKFPGLFAVNFFGQEIRVIHQPEMVQHILVRNSQNYKKDRGYQILALFLGNGLITNADYASWRKQRTLLQPPFHRESLDNMCKIVAKSLEHLLEQWKQKEGTVINLTQEMAWLTIDIVSKTLFTTDVSEEHIQMIWESINYLNAASMTMIRNPYHIPWKFPIPRHIKARKYISGVDNLIYSIIHKRKQQKNPPRDLLQLLIEARYEDGTAMSDEQIRDEVITVFVAVPIF